MRFKVGDKVKFKVGKGFGDGIDNVTKHDTGVIVSIDDSGDELPLLVACTTDKGKTIEYYMGAKREVVLIEKPVEFEVGDIVNVLGIPIGSVNGSEERFKGLATVTSKHHDSDGVGYEVKFVDNRDWNSWRVRPKHLERIESVQQSDDDTPCDDIHAEHHLDHMIDLLREKVRRHKIRTTEPTSVVHINMDLDYVEIMIQKLESHARLTY